MTSAPSHSPTATAAVTAPLYAAGFVAASSAHTALPPEWAPTAVISGLSLLNLGILLAVYDLAEVVLKPVFGALSDRIGTKPVVVAGLFAFALMSLIGLWGANPLTLGLARIGQGAAASAFSPASSAMVARLAGPNAGTYFGRYGSWKSLGYVAGPLIGAALIFLGGFPLLFAALGILAAATAVWAMAALPRLDPLRGPGRRCWTLPAR